MTHTTATPPLVSVIINNYNYAAYVGQAIESVLRQTYPAVELIVVDDGSTDHSRSVIEAFGSKLTAVFKTNGGHGSCFNAGFARCHGDYVFFLDADDYYGPETIANAVAAFKPDVAMVQFRMYLVDTNRQVIGVHPPAPVEFQSGDVVPHLLERGRYVGTVTTGLGFSRQALERILPLDERRFVQAADGCLLYSAPFLGKVATITTPNAFYRRHGANDSSMNVPHAKQLAQVRKLLGFGRNEVAVIATCAHAQGLPVPADLEYRNPYFLIYRLASLRLDPAGHPWANDHALTLGRRGVLATWRCREELGKRQTFKLGMWFALVAALPSSMVRPAIEFLLFSESLAYLQRLKAAKRRWQTLAQRKRLVPAPTASGGQAPQ